jgi:hypothetical protein
MSRRIRWAGHVARMGEERKMYVQGFGGKARRKDNTRKTDTYDGRMASELILGGLAGGVRSGLSWPRIGTGEKLL